MLLNTCHDEFEASREERVALLGKSLRREDFVEEERRAKQRMMGTVRLIGHLFLRGEVPGWVMSELVQDLLSPAIGGVDQRVDEGDVEALCEMFSIAGKLLDEKANAEADANANANASNNSNSERAKLDRSFKRLSELSSDKNVSSRVRFLIRDLLDARNDGWTFRRETQTAKKLDEIRAEAELQLGMAIPKADGFAAMGMGGMGRSGGRDVELFPALRSEGGGGGGGGVGGAGTGYGGGGIAGGSGKYTHQSAGGESVSSDLLGTFVPRAQTTTTTSSGGDHAARGAASAGGRGKGAIPPASSGPLSEEELNKKAKGMMDEFVSVGDEKELLVCVAELQAGDQGGVSGGNGHSFMTKLVTQICEKMLELISDRDHGMMLKLMSCLTRHGVVTTDIAVQGLASLLATLGDLCMDVPLAPKLLGLVVGTLLADGTLAVTHLPALLNPCEDAYPRRELAEHALHYLRSKWEDAKVGAAFREKGVAGSSFLTHDPQFDGDMPEVGEWLREKGFTMIPA